MVGIAGLGKAFEIATDNLEILFSYSRNQGLRHPKTFRKIRNSFNGRSAERDKKSLHGLSVSLPSQNPLIGLQLDMKGIAGFTREVHVVLEQQNHHLYFLKF